MTIAIILFPQFETLDVFGPVELFGRLQTHYTMQFISLQGGIISNHHGVHVQTESLNFVSDKLDILLIPGGIGTRTEIHNNRFIKQLTELARKSKFVLSVCTGSALLAKTGLLQHRTATTNKRAFNWVRSQAADISWVPTARWIADGKWYTSAGVSAGMDMCLGFIQDQLGRETALRVANEIEYSWHEDANPSCGTMN